MASKGSISWELLVELDRGKPRGLRTQIEDSVRDAIRSGRLSPETRLPSSRALAADLDVSRGVVVSAYEQLVAEGYLRSRTGAGTTVSTLMAPAPASIAPRDDQRAEFDLRPAVPDLDLFPRAAWNRAARVAVNSMPRDDLGYTDHRGLDRLRVAVADYLGRVRGVATSPELVMICNGFGHGYGIVLEALRDLGHRDVATEEPGYDDTRLVAARLGLRVHPVRVDDDGLRADELTATEARIVALTPAHQAPLGVVLTPDRRRHIAEWASEVDGYVIEDDYDAEFRYDRQPIGALQGIAPDRTIYMGTLSKCLAPGLRLGWVVLPPTLLEPVLAVRGLVDGTTSTLTQATFAEFLLRGDHDRHIRRSRRIYRRRRDALTAALADRVSEAVVGTVRAGLHLPLVLPSDVDEDRAVDAARERGVLVSGMSEYRSRTADHRPALVVGFGRLPEHAAGEAAARLAGAVADARITSG